MSCTFTLAGALRECKNALGGAKEIYLAIRGTDIDPANITVDGTTEKVTAITMEAGKLFKTYQVRENVANMVVAVNTSPEAGTTFHETTITFNLAKANAEKRLDLKNLAKAELVAIVRDKMNQYWLVGLENPVMLSAGGMNTGTAMADPNQVEYTLMCQESEPPREVTTTILSAIIDSNMSYPVPAGA